MAAWQDEIDSLKQGGFSSTEIGDYQTQRKQELVGAGFTEGETNKYFGVPEFDPKAAKDVVSANIARTKEVDPETQKPKMKQATSMLEAFEAGWGMSVTGLGIKAPTSQLGGDAGMFMRLANSVGTLAGDVPAMVAGGAIGGGTGNPVAAAFGAFALPSAMRKVLMDHYEKGDVKDFADFFERTTGALWEEFKGGVTGAATAGAGGVVGKLASPIVGGVLGKSAQLATEVATMVTVGKALEGQAPQRQDFLDAGILVLGLHGAMKALPSGGGNTVQTEFGEVQTGTGIPKNAEQVASTLRQVYAETGHPPSEVALEAQKNPVLQQELVANNPDPQRIKNIMGEKPSLDAPEEPGSKLSEQRGSVSAKAVPEPEPIPRSEAVQTALDKIKTQTEKTKESYSFKKLYTDLVDKLAPLKEVDPEAYVEARMVSKYRDKAVHAIKFGTFDYETLKPNGEPIETILKDTKDPEGLDAYMFARTELERGQRKDSEGKPFKTRIPLETAAKIVEEGKGQFDELAQRVTKFENRNLEYLKKSGYFSDEQFKRIMEAQANHAPLKKIIEPGDQGTGSKAGFLKTAQGGTGDIQSPLLSVLENTEAIYRMAEKNRAVRTFVDNDLAESKKPIYNVDELSGAANSFNPKKEPLLTLVNQGMTVAESNPAEMQRWMKENAIPGKASDKTNIELYRKSQKFNLGENQIEVMRDGVREVYEGPTDVMQAIKSLDGNPASQLLFMRLAQGVTRGIKFGTTFTPDFVVRNMIRDQVTQGVLTKANIVPFTQMFDAMGHILREDQVFKDALKSGALSGTFIDPNEGFFKQDILKLQKETGFMDGLFNAIKNPIDTAKETPPGKALEFMSYLVESAPRLAEYKNSVGTERQKGFAGAESTLDFQKQGARFAAVNSITAFAQVQLNGLDKMISSFKEAPGSFAVRGFAYITAPSLFLWYANHDEDWYKALPQWEKDVSWHVKVGGVIFRIPKPLELGMVFGSIPERLLEKYVADNPRALKNFNSTMLGVILPNLVPDIARAPIEQMFNKSFFTGAPLVSATNEKYVAAEQYTDYTSESAKQIGKLISVIDKGVHSFGLPSVGDIGPKDAKLGSPQVIENWVRAWSGQTGAYALQLIDQALYLSGAAKDLKPSMALSDIPFVKAFVSRYPRANSQPMTDFEDRYEDSKKNVATAKMLTKTNQGDKALQFYQEHGDDMATLEKTKDIIEKQSMAIRKIYANPNMTKTDKRQLIDGLYYGMTQAAAHGNKILDMLDTARNSKK